MLLGHFEQAWQAERCDHGAAGRLTHIVLAGRGRCEGTRVMLRCLHGFGDAVQMLRYVPALREVAASVTLEVAPALWSSRRASPAWMR